MAGGFLKLLQHALLFEGLVILIGVVGKGIDADAAAGEEVAGHLQVLGIHEAHEVLHDNVDTVLMEIAVVAEREEVELERLALHHPLARDITNVEVPEIGLTGLGAEGGKLRTIECHEVLVLRMLVGEGLQHLGVVLIRVVYMLVSQQGHALQFVVCSHK